MRLTSKQIKDLMNQEGVSRIWSWSKWNCYNTSHFEYYLKYIRRIPEDRATSIYATTGSIAHDILERLYTGQLTYNKMIDDFNDGWLTAYNISNLKFDRNNEEQDKKISDKYYLDLCHFFKNHTLINHNVTIEQFVKAKIKNNLFQGYVDLSYEDENGCTHIIDFKTSSIYKGKKAEKECGQLIIYAIGMNQKGIPFNKIKIGWNFLKYCTIFYKQANGTVKSREVERCKIGESLQNNVKMWLKKLGYEEQVDYYLMQMLDTNGIDCLPDDVKSLYTILDCIVYVPITEKLINSWTNKICNQISDIIAREEDYRDMKKRNVNEDTCCKVFWDSDDSVKEQSYYFSTLCGYSPVLHKPYGAYLDRMNITNTSDLFNNVGNEVEKFNKALSSNSNTLTNDIDLSWLNDI